MVVPGEAFLGANLAMNAACLIAAARLCGLKTSPWRVLISALAGAACAMAALAGWGTRAGGYAAVPLAALMVLLAFGARGAARGMVPLFFAGVLGAGAADYLHRLGLRALPLLMVCAPMLPLAARLFLRRRDHAFRRAELRLLFAKGGVTLDALVDTGNLLRDPVTALPVVVVSCAAIRRFLPETCDCDNPDTLPRGFRLISVRTAAGMRLMMCFRPRALFLLDRGVWRQINAIVAVSGALKRPRALLPPSINF